ncbi:MAG: hypothetical protein ACK4NS_00785 [Saprospiraceae bacterium]
MPATRCASDAEQECNQVKAECDALLRQLSALREQADSLTRKQRALKEERIACKRSISLHNRDAETLANQLEEAKRDEQRFQDEWCFLWDQSCRRNREQNVARCRETQREILLAKERHLATVDSLELEVETLEEMIQELAPPLKKAEELINDTKVKLDSCNTRYMRLCPELRHVEK